MAKNANPKPGDLAQSKRFIDEAKRLEADESGKAFESAMKAVAPAKRRRKRPIKPNV